MNETKPQETLEQKQKRWQQQQQQRLGKPVHADPIGKPLNSIPLGKLPACDLVK